MTTDELKRAEELCDGDWGYSPEESEEVAILLPKLVEEVKRLKKEVAWLKRVAYGVEGE